LTFYNDTTKQRLNTHITKFMLKILNLEIKDNFKQRRMLISSIYRISKNIENRLPVHTYCKFFTTQNLILNKFSKLQNNRLQNDRS